VKIVLNSFQFIKLVCNGQPHFSNAKTEVVIGLFVGSLVVFNGIVTLAIIKLNGKYGLSMQRNNKITAAFYVHCLNCI